ncbi:LpxI family protein [Pelagibius litoralis]|uniref:LpxI family protein n=1 Tax=Pelagibius litoralis TaxID=374515 RepID=A0A967C1K4_9PROT|nr:UDP-2,3-diacylglucosamine diphosphatase LpxI [Pelagibius litoralis]NIA67306.1 LpxI family protein [Pelagibius litoralis]
MPGPLGIVAGGGHLPRQLVELCQSNGRGAFVVALEGNTEAATVEGVDHLWIKLGQTKRALDALRKAEVRELVLIGPVKRPSMSELWPDAYTLKGLAKIGFNRLGDDGLLGAVVRTLEAEGFTIRGVDELMSELLAVAGPYGRFLPDAQAEADIARGVEVVRAMGAADVGQATVVQGGLVLGVEAIEGTDALLQRCGPLQRAGPGGVLVKLSKPGQERRADLPTVGVKTVEGAAAAGLRGIAIEAGATLVVDAEAVRRAVDDAGLFLIGIDLST